MFKVIPCLLFLSKEIPLRRRKEMLLSVLLEIYGKLYVVPDDGLGGPELETFQSPVTLLEEIKGESTTWFHEFVRLANQAEVPQDVFLALHELDPNLIQTTLQNYESNDEPIILLLVKEISNIDISHLDRAIEHQLRSFFEVNIESIAHRMPVSAFNTATEKPYFDDWGMDKIYESCLIPTLKHYFSTETEYTMGIEIWKIFARCVDTISVDDLTGDDWGDSEREALKEKRNRVKLLKEYNILTTVETLYREGVISEATRALLVLTASEELGFTVTNLYPDTPRETARQGFIGPQQRPEEEISDPGGFRPSRRFGHRRNAMVGRMASTHLDDNLTTL